MYITPFKFWLLFSLGFVAGSAAAMCAYHVSMLFKHRVPYVPPLPKNIVPFKKILKKKVL